MDIRTNTSTAVIVTTATTIQHNVTNQTDVERLTETKNSIPGSEDVFPGQLTEGHIAGIAVGIVVTLLIVAVAILGQIRNHRKRKAKGSYQLGKKSSPVLRPKNRYSPVPGNKDDSPGEDVGGRFSYEIPVSSRDQVQNAHIYNEIEDDLYEETEVGTEIESKQSTDKEPDKKKIKPIRGKTSNSKKLQDYYKNMLQEAEEDPNKGHTADTVYTNEEVKTKPHSGESTAEDEEDVKEKDNEENKTESFYENTDTDATSGQDGAQNETVDSFYENTDTKLEAAGGDSQNNKDEVGEAKEAKPAVSSKNADYENMEFGAANIGKIRRGNVYVNQRNRPSRTRPSKTKPIRKGRPSK